MTSKESKKFLRDFIQVYRSYPCLWQIKHDGYRDKRMKTTAYDALVKKLKEVYIDADRDMVSRKINILRTAFRREYKKVRSTALKHPKHRYKSSLWCYDLLRFVVEENEPPTRLSKEEDINDEIKWEYTEPIEHQEEIVGERERLTDDIEKIEHSASSEPTFHTVFLDVNDTYDTLTDKNQQCRVQDPCMPSKNVEHACEIIAPRENCSAHNDDFQVFANYVATKLRKSAARQSMIAEKIIADVLLKANLGVLTENTSLREERTSQRFL